jgi:hypothetical protein
MLQQQKATKKPSHKANIINVLFKYLNVSLDWKKEVNNKKYWKSLIRYLLKSTKNRQRIKSTSQTSALICTMPTPLQRRLRRQWSSRKPRRNQSFNSTASPPGSQQQRQQQAPPPPPPTQQTEHSDRNGLQFMFRGVATEGEVKAHPYKYYYHYYKSSLLASSQSAIILSIGHTSLHLTWPIFQQNKIQPIHDVFHSPLPQLMLSTTNNTIIHLGPQCNPYSCASSLFMTYILSMVRYKIHLINNVFRPITRRLRSSCTYYDIFVLSLNCQYQRKWPHHDAFSCRLIRPPLY